MPGGGGQRAEGGEGGDEERGDGKQSPHAMTTREPARLGTARTARRGTLRSRSAARLSLSERDLGDRHGLVRLVAGGARYALDLLDQIDFLAQAEDRVAVVEVAR